MWMVDYNDGGEFNMADHAFNGRKLRPLIPRPMTSPHINTSTTTTPCLNRAHATDFFSQYHNLASVTEQSKREFNTSPPVVVSTRWNPTPEQLRALEELYRRGTRTPSAEQIQHITAQLRRFGKIEGKNVFYWFQNHKARERQKRRRQVESAAAEGHHPRDHLDNLEKKDLGAIRTVFEVEQTKNWAPSTNCSTLTEESVSIQRAAAAAKAAVAESRTDGWVQFDELGELEQHQRRNFIEKNATWHMMQSSSCPPPTCSTTSNIATTTATVTGRGLMDPTLIKTHGHLSFFLSPHRENGVIQINSIISSSEEDENRVESQTLQLFPLGSGNINQKETEISVPAMNANLTPSQFFEFLPLKN